MARNRHTRYGLFDRVRHRRGLSRFLAAQATRLAASASTAAITIAHTSAVAAVGVLTMGTQPASGKVVSVGGRAYTFRTALTEAKASSVYTVGGGGSVIQNGNTLVLNGKTYTWQTVLTNVDGNVLIGANDTAALLNMLRAITLGAGSGTLYAAATTAHPTMTATASNATTLTVKALTVGVAGNALTTTESSPGSFTGLTLAGGVDAIADEVLISDTAAHSRDNLVLALTAGSGVGVSYSTGTVDSATVDAANTTVLTVTALVASAAGNSIALSTDVGSASWDADHLQGGVTEAFGPAISVADSTIYTNDDGPYVMAGVARPTGVASTDLFWVHAVDATHIRVSHSPEARAALSYEHFADAGTSVVLKRAAAAEGIFELLRHNSAGRIAAASDIDNLA